MDSIHLSWILLPWLPIPSKGQQKLKWLFFLLKAFSSTFPLVSTVPLWKTDSRRIPFILYFLWLPLLHPTHIWYSLYDSRTIFALFLFWFPLLLFRTVMISLLLQSFEGPSGKSVWKITQEHRGNYVMGQMPTTNKNLLTLFPEKNQQLEPDISSTYLRNKGELPLLHRRYCPLLLKFCNTMPLLDNVRAL